MADNTYDQIEIEDMTWEEERKSYYYPCPCGDMFAIHIDDLRDGSNDIATCPSCSLQIRVIYDIEDLPPLEEEEDMMMQMQAPMAVAVAA